MIPENIFKCHATWIFSCKFLNHFLHVPVANNDPVHFHQCQAFSADIEFVTYVSVSETQLTERSFTFHSWSHWLTFGFGLLRFAMTSEGKTLLSTQDNNLETERKTPLFLSRYCPSMSLCRMSNFFTLLFITFIKFVMRSTHAACCENLVPVVGCVASEKFYSTVGKTWWSLVMGDHNNRETIASTVSMSPTALSNRRLRPNWRRHIKRCMFSISLYRHLLCTQRRNNIANWCNWYGHVVLQVGHSPSKTLVDNDTATGPTSLRLYQFIICFITDHIDIIPVCLSDR